MTTSEQAITINRREIHIPVNPPASATWSEWACAAWLTVPGQLRRDELQILVHGASYDHRYWDWPEQPEKYSYVAWCAERGLATLSIDRIGSGSSTRPSRLENTVDAQASVVSQVIAAARKGLPGAPSFSRIVLVGHSLGSIVAGRTAALFGDADAVVLTGQLGAASDTRNDDPRADMFYVAAEQDPGVSHLRGLVDEYYVTPRQEAREPIFYRTDQADPDIVAIDEQIKGVMTRGELSDMGTAANHFGDIKVPTFLVIGQHDSLMIQHDTDNDAYDAVERAKALSPEFFDFAVIPSVGHNLNLHWNARTCYDVINWWLDQQIDSGAPTSTVS